MCKCLIAILSHTVEFSWNLWCCIQTKFSTNDNNRRTVGGRTSLMPCYLVERIYTHHHLSGSLHRHLASWTGRGPELPSNPGYFRGISGSHNFNGAPGNIQGKLDRFEQPLQESDLLIHESVFFVMIQMPIPRHRKSVPRTGLVLSMCGVRRIPSHWLMIACDIIHLQFYTLWISHL